MSSDEIEGVQGVEGVSGTLGASKSAAPKVEEIQPEVVEKPNKEKFDSLMVDRQEQIAPVNNTNKVEQTPVGLMGELNQLNVKVDHLKGASPDNFLNKAQEVSSQMEELKSKLSSSSELPGGPSEDVLRNKLSHIDENLKVSLNRSGVEYSPVHKVDGQTSLQRFLSMLTDGQARLDSLSSDVNAMQLNGKDISPASMIALQIKVNFIQQEIELFTSLLSKSIESTKTIMNVQV